jgi:hypothetical protein
MTSITRRSLTLGLGASAALAAASPPIVADAAGQRAVLPSVASRKIGAVQVTAVSDGFIDVPFDVFTGAPISEIEAAFATRFSRPSTGMHRLGFTVWLVDDGDRLVLIIPAMPVWADPPPGACQPRLLRSVCRPKPSAPSSSRTCMPTRSAGSLQTGARCFPAPKCS